MFSALQQRTWSTFHLTGGAWYLDCPPNFTPSFEIELRKSREAIGEFAIEMVDLECIEDENERAKTIKRRIEEDRKKSLRVKKRDSSYEQLSQIPILTLGEDNEFHIDELIINDSTEDVLGGDTEFTPSYIDLKTLLLKARLSLNIVMICLPSLLCISTCALFYSLGNAFHTSILGGGHFRFVVGLG